VGRDAGYADLGGVTLQHLPDDLFPEALAGNCSAAIHWTEGVSGRDAGGDGPRINCHLHPCWHRRRPNAVVFSDEIYDAPAPVALLDVRERERRHFRASQPAAEEDG
jgi:hypothetical protein